MKRFVFIVLIFLSISFTGCGDLNLGPEYKKTPLVKYEKGEISIYDLSLGIDYGAYYISANKDVCEGFDSTKDFCFPPGVVVYYQMVKDTLTLYSTWFPPKPIHFPLPFKLNQVDDWNSLDKQYKEGLIHKIQFDTVFHAIPCSIIPYSKRNNLKFKKH